MIGEEIIKKLIQIYAEQEGVEVEINLERSEKNENENGRKVR